MRSARRLARGRWPPTDQWSCSLGHRPTLKDRPHRVTPRGCAVLGLWREGLRGKGPQRCRLGMPGRTEPTHRRSGLLVSGLHTISHRLQGNLRQATSPAEFPGIRYKTPVPRSPSGWVTEQEDAPRNGEALDGHRPLVVMSFGKNVYRTRHKIFHGVTITFPRDMNDGRGWLNQHRKVEQPGRRRWRQGRRSRRRLGVSPLPREPHLPWR